MRGLGGKKSIHLKIKIMFKTREKNLIKGLISSHLSELIKECEMINYKEIDKDCLDWEELEFKILKTIANNTL